MNSALKRLPALTAVALFVALCASATYWALQWLAPTPRAVAAPVVSERAMPAVASAANLFGGATKGGAMVNVQLRGILHAGRESGSVAILTADGKPPMFFRLNAEVMPGVTVKAIHAKTVVLSDRGVERELALPAFATQEGAAGGAPQRPVPEQPAAPQPTQPQGQLQGQPQGQPQGMQMAPQSQSSPAQAGTAGTNAAGPQAAGPSTMGSVAAGADQPARPPSRNNRRRPRYQDD